MPSSTVLDDTSNIQPSEIDAALTATASSRLINGKNKVQHLGNVKTPTLNTLRGLGKTNATPVRGGYKAMLVGPRGQRLQSVSGRDIHTFKSVDTLFDIEFKVGRVHLGDEWVHQQLEEAGLSIDYAEASQTKVDISKDGWWTKGADAFETIVNLANIKLEAHELNFQQELNKAMWRSNLGDPKMWPGFDAMLSRTSNTTGPVGNKDRSDPNLRHKLSSSVASGDIELALNRLRRACNKRTHDGTSVSMTVCGETFYDAIVERLFSGSAAVTSPRLTRNIENARSDAAGMAQKLGIGFPDDALYIVGVGLLMIEPCFEDLDREDAPATLWAKSAMMLNTDHVQFKPTKKKDGAVRVHATPYNQNVTRISRYGEYALVSDKLDCQGVMVLT